MLARFVVAIAASLFVLPAAAVELTQKGALLVISGDIRNGDEFALRDLLASPAGRQVRLVALHSPGGRVAAAHEMARSIRKAGLVTLVDGARAVCSSACTALFAAGVRRHYVNAGAIADGESKIPRGLGFHEGNSLQRSGSKGYSGAGTAGMIAIYYEMGVSGAVGLVSKASYDRIYRVSGPTAMALGIATSLSPP
jgi:hypothetical protein